MPNQMPFKPSVADQVASVGPQRDPSNTPPALCATVKGGYEAAKPGDPALVVAISPNSSNQANVASQTNLVKADAGSSLPGGFVAVLPVNVLRAQFILQNVGNVPIYVRLGLPLEGDGISPSGYHFVLKADSTGGGAPTGDGGVVSDAIWKGDVYIVGASGSLCSVVEESGGAKN